MIFLKFIVLIIKINALYIYEKFTNTYLSSSKGNESVIATKNPEHAINFEFLPLSSIEKTCLISKGNGYVMDLAQDKARNKIIYWKRHGQVNQQFKILDVFTNSVILSKDINDYQEYKIMINGMCAYVKEITSNNYRVYVRVCDVKLPGSIFKITLDKYINEHTILSEASALHHYKHGYLNNPVTSIPHVAAEAIAMNLETLPLEEKYLKQKHYNIVTMSTPRDSITSESYMPVYHQNHKLITTPTEELISAHNLQHDNFHFNHARNALERHLIKDHNYIIN